MRLRGLVLAARPHSQRIDPDVRKRLVDADWVDIGIRLTAYATWKARNFQWRTQRTVTLAAGKTPEDVAREAIMKVIDGTRGWDPERGPLFRYLQGVVDSLMSHLAQSADNTMLERLGDRDPAQIDPARPEPTRGEETIAHLRTTLEQRREGDLLAVLDAVQRCDPKPQAIALHLRTTVNDVNNRLKRLRRLALKILESRGREEV